MLAEARGGEVVIETVDLEAVQGAEEVLAPHPGAGATGERERNPGTESVGDGAFREIRNQNRETIGTSQVCQ